MSRVLISIKEDFLYNLDKAASLSYSSRSEFIRTACKKEIALIKDRDKEQWNDYKKPKGE